jgi:formylmethanofuran dehydrogenase subunit E
MLEAFLTELKRLHPRLCPRQVLGVRIGVEAGALLRVDVPRTDKRLLVFVETDGCFADGLSVATGCWLGRRTLRLVDYGKVAATIVDTRSGRAFRLWPHPAARSRAWDHALGATSRWHAQLVGYQVMPSDQLLCIQEVELEIPVEHVAGRSGRVTCSVCDEEILNGRELLIADGPRCRARVRQRHYYRQAAASAIEILC